MAVGLRFLVCFILFGSSLADRCNTAAFLECTCQSGGRDGIILVCNRMPTCEKEDMISLQVLHIYVKTILAADSIEYDTDIWPRLKTISDLQKKLICKDQICALMDKDDELQRESTISSNSGVDFTMNVSSVSTSTSKSALLQNIQTETVTQQIYVNDVTQNMPKLWNTMQTKLSMTDKIVSN